MDRTVDRDQQEGPENDLGLTVRAGQRQQRSGAPEGIRTPNLLIRSQMLYPLSYGRSVQLCTAVTDPGSATPVRRLRDLNPGWGVTPNRISSAAP